MCLCLHAFVLANKLRCRSPVAKLFDFQRGSLGGLLLLPGLILLVELISSQPCHPAVGAVIYRGCHYLVGSLLAFMVVLSDSEDVLDSPILKRMLQSSGVVWRGMSSHARARFSSAFFSDPHVAE